MTAPELIAAIKDIVLAIAAAITAGAAVLGLWSWRRELTGKAGFVAARALALATYKLRDELKYCRSPMLWSHEFPPDYRSVGKTSPQEETDAYSHLYRNRLKPVWEALQGFDARALEGEALWGSAIQSKAEVLRQCVREVWAAIEAILDDKRSGGLDFQADRDFAVKMRVTVSAVPKDDENEMSQLIRKAIAALEDEIRPHLRRR